MPIDTVINQEFELRYEKFNNLVNPDFQKINSDALNNSDPLFYYLSAIELDLNEKDGDENLFSQGEQMFLNLNLSNNNSLQKNTQHNYGFKKSYFNPFSLDNLKEIRNGLVNSNISNEIYQLLNPVEIVALYIGINAAKKNKVSYDENDFNKTISNLVSYSFKKNSNILNKFKSKSDNSLDSRPNRLIERMKYVSLDSAKDFMNSLREKPKSEDWQPGYGSKSKQVIKKEYIDNIFQIIEAKYNANNT